MTGKIKRNFSRISCDKLLEKFIKFLLNPYVQLAVVFILSFVCGGLISYAVFGRRDSNIIYEPTSTTPQKTTIDESTYPQETTTLFFSTTHSEPTKSDTSPTPQSTSSLTFSISTTTDSTSTFLSTSEPAINQTTVEVSSSDFSTSSSFLTTFEPNLNLIVLRSEWTSDPINPSIPLLSNSSFPIRRIIVGQTDDAETCMNRSECIAKVKEIKNRHPALLDIPWNFLIGGDGFVYEGRGYRYEGEHTMNVDGSEYNDIGLGIGLIGNFSTQKPSSLMLNAFQSFLLTSLESGNLMDDYKIFLHDHLTYKEVEAFELGSSLRDMDKFYELQKIYKREEWGALRSLPGVSSMDNPLERVIIHHTATRTCNSYLDCTQYLKVLQNNAMSISFNLSDINYNFIIGGADDYAIVMEGRGFSKRGAHTAAYNGVSVGIGLIGNFNIHEASPALMAALRTFIDDSAALGKLTKDYLLHVKRDIDGSASPGDNVINIVNTWPDYSKP